MKKVIYSTIAILLIAGASAFAGNTITGKGKAACTCDHCTCPDAPHCVCSK